MKLRPLDPRRARTRKLATLSRLVGRGDLATPIAAGASMRAFFDALPDVLAARDLLTLARDIARAHRAGRTVLLMMGAHPIKVGLTPIICRLIRDGIVSAVATNGAAIIHDFELAFAGRTSEDVGEGLTDGSFGMAEETGRLSQPRRGACVAGRQGTGRDRGPRNLKVTL